jgi:hypothetical protein
MKVFDLRCEQGHVFEGWFAFEDQQARGLVACPVCSATSVAKLPAAPRLNLSGAKAPAAERAATRTSSSPTNAEVAAPVAASASASASAAASAAPWVKALREVLARSENVGDRFAEEARKMHYGESEERGIHGRATREQAEALLDEGIDVVPLSLPGTSNETLH